MESVTYFAGTKKIQMKSEGYWKKYHDGSQERILHGFQRTWYESGQLHTELFFVDGVLTGQSTIWWPNGNIKVKNNFDKDGLMDGEQFLYDSDGNLLKSYPMDHGTGIEYIFHENGVLKQEKPWAKGVLEGIVKSYDTSGTLLSTKIYAQGVPQD